MTCDWLVIELLLLLVHPGPRDALPHFRRWRAVHGEGRHFVQQHLDPKSGEVSSAPTVSFFLFSKQHEMQAVAEQAQWELSWLRIQVGPLGSLVHGAGRGTYSKPFPFCGEDDVALCLCEKIDC